MFEDQRAYCFVVVQGTLAPAVANAGNGAKERHLVREPNEFEVADLGPRRLPRHGWDTGELRETNLITQ